MGQFLDGGFQLHRQNGFSDVDRGLIVENLGRKFDGRLEFAIELVEAIPSSRRGKAVFVDQQTPGVDGGALCADEEPSVARVRGA